MFKKSLAFCRSKFAGADLCWRSISSVVLVPLVLLVVYRGGSVFGAVVAVVVLVGAVEWVRLVKAFERGGLRKLFWLVLGLPYVGGSGLALIYLRVVPDEGMKLTFYLLMTVWATDIGAFLAGRLIGGPRLCPKISPKKTWAGLIGGMALSALIGYGAGQVLGATQPWFAAKLALALAVVAQMGDLFESWVKRRAGAKDSGTLIPGHGGVLDRIDGLMFAAVFLAACQIGGLS